MRAAETPTSQFMLATNAFAHQVIERVAPKRKLAATVPLVMVSPTSASPDQIPP